MISHDQIHCGHWANHCTVQLVDLQGLGFVVVEVMQMSDHRHEHLAVPVLVAARPAKDTWSTGCYLLGLVSPKGLVLQHSVAVGVGLCH